MIVTEQNANECVNYRHHSDYFLKMILKEIEGINNTLEKIGRKDKQICLKYYKDSDVYKVLYKNDEKGSASVELYDLDQISTIIDFMKDFIENN